MKSAINSRVFKRFGSGTKPTLLGKLIVFPNELSEHERMLPCKVSCSWCGTLIADEGRKKWLAFPSLFDFGGVSRVPMKFKPTCHIFIGMRVIDINDNLPKWLVTKIKAQNLISWGVKSSIRNFSLDFGHLKTY